ncbi:hypothetical protein OG21DRAFT_1490522 [Imleria badia]|nr:hypothetical protein OG21DRAFT_1490522 [Imleria badia]
MQPAPNRLGLGLHLPQALPSYGQGPSISALAQQQQMMHQPFMPPQKQTTLFIGSISDGITDASLNQMLSVSTFSSDGGLMLKWHIQACGPIKSFKRLITPANKPQGFGFAEFEDPDSAIRCLTLLQGVELPALEDGCANKKHLIKADEKTTVLGCLFWKTDAVDAMMQQAKANVDGLVEEINRTSQDAANNGLLDKEKYVIPPHLHDIQEADLPETQRGLIISEIAQFRECAANEKSGPKLRDWACQFCGNGEGAQGCQKTRRGVSVKDRKRRYELRERARIAALEHWIARQNAIKEGEEWDRVEMQARIDVWDDDKKHAGDKGSTRHVQGLELRMTNLPPLPQHCQLGDIFIGAESKHFAFHKGD